MTSRLRDFMRTNPVILLVSKVGDDPQEFFDEVYNIAHAVGVTFREKKRVCFVAIKRCYSSVVHKMERQ